MTDRTPVANIAPFGLRMQPELKSRIEAAAKANSRSMNAEIIYRLENSLLGYESPSRQHSLFGGFEPEGGLHEGLSETELLAVAEAYAERIQDCLRTLAAKRRREGED